MNTQQARQLAIRTSARAFANLFDGVQSSTRQALGLSHRPLAGGTLLAAASLPHMMLNRLIGAAPAGIDAAVATVERLGITRYLLSFDADAFDQALSYGARHGLVRFRRPWATLIRQQQHARPLPVTRLPNGFELRPASHHDAEALGALMARAFEIPARGAPIFAAAIERPGWLAVVAEQDGELAGAGIAYLDGQCAYLAGGATAPQHRRRGIQRALVAARVRWAAEHGAHLICSETGVAIPEQTNSSWHNLEWAGLEPVSQIEHLCRAGTGWGV